MARFTETIYLDSSAKIDPEKGEIRGVKLLGSESRNGRTYLASAMKEAAKLYSGKKVYIDHPNRSEMDSDRSIQDWAGTIKNARYESNGLFGDVKLRKASPHFAGIIEAAQEFPNDIGFSHIADGSSSYEGETEIVASIKEVFSVDLVADPATTSGFFESKDRKKTTLKAAVESLPEHPVRKRLLEMMASEYLDGGMAMGGKDEPTDPMTQMASIIKELIGQLGDALSALANAKSAPPPTTPPAPAPEDDMANTETPVSPAPAANAEDDKQKLAFESLQRENAELKARTLLLESGRDATPARIKALASAPEADRAELLESWAALPADERPARSPAALLESTEQADFPRDPARFAAALR